VIQFLHTILGNKFLTTAIYCLDFIHRPYVLQTQRFEGWFFPRHQVKPNLLGLVDRASLYRWTMDKVQTTDRSNTAPSSKTFRYEVPHYLDKECERIPRVKEKERRSGTASYSTSMLNDLLWIYLFLYTVKTYFLPHVITE
jgi:hypothetical protein